MKSDWHGEPSELQNITECRPELVTRRNSGAAIGADKNSRVEQRHFRHGKHVISPGNPNPILKENLLPQKSEGHICGLKKDSGEKRRMYAKRK
ncbi:hypothetical protein N7535_007269 [Penicillium sp. DV-2018c]|nr:hypothetical protein N7461_003295 [Penicillium sp. DV-2018c]KAJ5565631.1 hypothetical protein N7535_007269 [Penicillium sp. DV-2018c]